MTDQQRRIFLPQLSLHWRAEGGPAHLDAVSPPLPDPRAVHPATYRNMSIFRDGQRVATPESLEAFSAALAADPQAVGWYGIYRPAAADIVEVARAFDLHELAVEDAIVAHQRPKLERYGQTLFVVLSAARYLDDLEEVEFGELHVFMGPNFVITMRHAESPDLRQVMRRLQDDPKLLTLGPEAILYAIMDQVVDGYGPVVAGLENDIDEIETQIFSGDPAVSRRIYELSREVIDFRRATQPLNRILRGLQQGADRYGVSEELQRYLRDVIDHNTVVAENVQGFQQILRDMLTVNATLVNQEQNNEMKAMAEAEAAQNDEIKKISSWAAILFAPTLVGTIYGMNFVHMPELQWYLGYPFALTLMGLVCLTLYLVFKRRGWL